MLPRAPLRSGESFTAEFDVLDVPAVQICRTSSNAAFNDMIVPAAVFPARVSALLCVSGVLADVFRNIAKLVRPCL